VIINKIFKIINGGIEFSVYLTPGSSKEEITGILQGGLRISVHAKPTNNQANVDLIELLSTLFNIAKSRIIIKNGFKSRTKTIFINSYQILDIPDKTQLIIGQFTHFQNKIL
jgi:uncharacterized protein (TIGR00251 family)